MFFCTVSKSSLIPGCQRHHPQCKTLGYLRKDFSLQTSQTNKLFMLFQRIRTGKIKGENKTLLEFLPKKQFNISSFTKIGRYCCCYLFLVYSAFFVYKMKQGYGTNHSPCITQNLISTYCLSRHTLTVP